MREGGFNFPDHNPGPNPDIPPHRPGDNLSELTSSDEDGVDHFVLYEGNGDGSPDYIAMDIGSLMPMEDYEPES